MFFYYQGWEREAGHDREVGAGAPERHPGRQEAGEVQARFR